MSAIAIRVEGIGKQFRIGAAERYRTLRDTLTDALHPARWFKKSTGSAAETFWALKDVSFEVNHGEVIGIIGRNGAGKSTLLKILSRITEPTEGHAEIHGRVGSLLEVGTGFHGELSGRENIFLNGAILGMKKAEISRKFHEIVAFAEVEKFIDTPVKHYSSGMYVRLAFAVAAHLEPEILIVDEVLAVGDMEFQRKCLGKMGEVAKEGRTVILVSHSMASISSLCTSAIVLDRGRIAYQGNVDTAISQYLAPTGESLGNEFTRPAGQPHTAGDIFMSSGRVLNQFGEPRSRFDHGEDIIVEFSVAGSSTYRNYLAVVKVRTTSGITILHIPTPPELDWPLSDATPKTVRCTIPNCRLYPGQYVVSIWIGRSAHWEVDWLPDVLSFTVEQGDLASYGFDMTWFHGLYFCDSEWLITQPTQAAVSSL